MANWNIADTWNRAYRTYNGRPDQADQVLATGEGFGEFSTYLDGRKWALHKGYDGDPGLAYFRNRVRGMGPIFNPANDILVVGCGFGWLVEAAVDLGSTTAWGCDTSQAIWDAFSSAGIRPDIAPRILNVDFTAPDAADQFRNLGAGNNRGLFRTVITEHVLEDWDIGTIDTALDACDDLLAGGQSRVIHIVLSTNQIEPENFDSEFVPNQFSLADWALLRPSHYWVDTATGEVEGGL